MPIVGPDQIAAGRDMHWLRIDDYIVDGKPGFSPVPCMHCEHAPCEPVCPVAASVHDSEGLNLQVYNRCVGTRFCQSNCPYKVRRFNFFGYADGEEYKSFGADIVKAVFNPDVTVRGRGVMEKCTYCVQRISRRAAQRREGASHRSAMARSSPPARLPARRAPSASAISPIRTRISMRCAREPHAYALLGDLGTRPRTTYLARLQNPNPDFGSNRHEHGGGYRRAQRRRRSAGRCRSARDLESRQCDCSRRRCYERGAWTWRAWWIAFAISGALTTVFTRRHHRGCSSRGVGVWGVNTTVVWGFAIADYVWWIGIGNAGTLISAMLLLMRQKWRASTNRFAEAMTLFAASHRRDFPDHPFRSADCISIG